MKIEYSNQAGSFTAADLQAKIRESRAFWSSPAGQAEKRKQDAANRNRRSVPTRFPELAKNVTKPSITLHEARLRLLNIYSR
jgi:2-polyprenyl-6-methoxyphenol hydroxylase-like FAD-dependent oxidoreductase